MIQPRRLGPERSRLLRREREDLRQRRAIWRKRSLAKRVRAVVFALLAFGLSWATVAHAEYAPAQMHAAPWLRDQSPALAAIAVAQLGGEFVDLTDRSSAYTTGSYTITNARPTYMLVNGSAAGGAHSEPTITCSNGDSLTLMSPFSPLAWGTAANKFWIYGFIPTSGGSVTFSITPTGGATWTQCAAGVYDVTGLHTADGIVGTMITDSNRFIQSFSNATSTSIPVQATWHADNVYLGLLWAGSSGLTLTATGTSTMVGTRIGSTGAASFGAFTGAGDNLSMSWTGSFSNAGHAIELRGSGTTLPPLTGRIIGTPFHDSTGGSSATFASFTPGANSLLVMFATHTSTAGSLRSFSSITGTLGLTWTQRGGNLDNDTVASPTQRTWCFTALTNGSPPTGTVIVTASGTTTGWHIVITQHTGHDTTTPIVQTATNNGDAGTAVSATLAAFGHANNGTLAYSVYDPAGAGDTIEGSGFEEFDEGSFASPSSEVHTEWRHSNDTTPTATLPANGDWGMFAVEIKAAPTSFAFTQASETDTALAFAEKLGVGFASETDTARGFNEKLGFSRASEIDTAGAFTLAGGPHAFTFAGETDTAGTFLLLTGTVGRPVAHAEAEGVTRGTRARPT